MVKPRIDDENLGVKSSQKILYYYFDVVFRLVIEPFEKIYIDGDMKLLIKNFAELANLYSYAGLPKVTRNQLWFCMQLQHMIEKRPDILKIFNLNFCRLNDRHSYFITILRQTDEYAQML